MIAPVLRSLVGVAVLSGSSLCLAAPPNIVLIVSDDQGWGDYGFMHHRHVQTPHIDRLARESQTFTRGYVPDSLCRPSLATIVTGLYPHQHGIVGNDPPLPEGVSRRGNAATRTDPRVAQSRNDYLQHIDAVPTIARLLHEGHGYLSHQSGKWWEGSFDRGGFTHGMTHGDPTRGGRHGDEGLAIGREGLQPIFDFIAEARAQQKPFFVYYAPMMPHTPHTPPERLLRKYQDLTPHLPVAKYWAMCEWFDETVGTLLGHLDAHGLVENTVVLYVTDNGWINQTDQSAYAPRSKRSQYDGGIRTPIMVRWPGHVEPGLDTTNLVSSIDLVPTMLAAASLKPTAAMQGINLLDREAVARRKTVYGGIFEHDIRHRTDPVPSLLHRWIIDGEWKLIVPYEPNVSGSTVELFRVTQDDREERNAARDYPDVVTRLSRQLDEWWTPAAAAPAPARKGAAAQPQPDDVSRARQSG
jgi:uncharacterized sulfatase